MPKIIKSLAAMLYICCFTNIAAAQSFQITPGDFYTANYFEHNIDRYDRNGKFLDSFTPAFNSAEVKGLAFGQDGMLYAVAADDPFITGGAGYSVIALDGSGKIRQTYHIAPSYIGGNLSLGKITFDKAGHFYVGSLAGLTRFDVGKPNSGTLIYQTSELYDVKALPSGNLLVADGYSINEITRTGKLVRKIPSPDISLSNIRGIEYNPATNTIFVTMLDNGFLLMGLNGATGKLLGYTSFNYGDDMFLADDGRLIVGSRTQHPGIFTQNLQQIGSFTGNNRMFVTQAPTAVPEPSALTVLLTVVAGGAFLQRRRRRCASNGV